eukprot:TRINITY_DN7795_c0_g1_i1.p1 TRINITY_DN7795_c0_g1~~TRINITY_DN7795_c0_g1_i1.p1  ORF type:complete len:507 (-),score=77.67 TRINITY_DN7795_c0_g1_i1:116-1636(-)
MDKICRGSRVGSAHNQGTWDQLDKTNTGFRRGGYVTHTQPKLENTAPRRLSTGQNSTDTFRSQAWFRHDGKLTPRSPPNQFSPRFARGAFGLSPAPSPRGRLQQSMSERSLRGQSQGQGQERESVASLFKQQSELNLRSPRSPRMKEKADPASYPEYAGARSMTRGRSETSLLGSTGREFSPRDTLLLSYPEDCRSPSADGRGSPTFATSEDWMGYSRNRKRSPSQQIDRTMPSSNFASSIRRQHSGKITRDSENWLRMDGEDATPTRPEIANSQNYQLSRGKKTSITPKDPEKAKRLMRLEANRVAEDPRTHRKHQFQEHPQAKRHVEELQMLSPRHLEQAAAADAVTRGTASATVAVQHRTSGEMAASLNPDTSAQQKASSAEKYLVGCELVDIQNSGLRRASSCMKVSEVNLRHHLNSDIVKDHLQPVDASYSRLHSIPNSREEAGRRVHVYGDYSAPPASMPKDTAYIHSGIKVVKYQTRSPGTFSPNAPRMPASAVLVSSR